MQKYRSVVLTLISIFMSLAVYAQPAASLPATYILHVSSNLSCKMQSIELISQADGSSQLLTFKTNSVATADLPAGTYEFGNVTCRDSEGLQTLNVLQGKVAPLTLESGQAYYGGTLLFKEEIDVDLEAGRKELEECALPFSRARGAPTNECQDGIGLDKSTLASKQINVFAPTVSKETLSAVRKALSVTENQLLYLPLKG